MSSLDYSTALGMVSVNLIHPSVFIKQKILLVFSPLTSSPDFLQNGLSDDGYNNLSHHKLQYNLNFETYFSLLPTFNINFFLPKKNRMTF